MAALSSEAGWERIGERVRVHTPNTGDLAPYAIAVERSRERLKPWNPVDPKDLGHHLRNQSDRHRTFLIRALQPEGEHDVVGKVNVTGIQRGRALSGTLGYDAYDPYAGQGLFTEGLKLVIQLAFAPSPHGVGLHRLEACVQPGNTASAGALRRLGFTRRGVWPRYLWLADADGVEAWRDHVVYGITREEWPALAYRATPPRGQVCRPLVVLLASDVGAEIGAGTGVPVDAAVSAQVVGRDGVCDPTMSTHVLVERGRRLALELGVPLLRDLEPAGHTTGSGGQAAEGGGQAAEGGSHAADGGPHAADGGSHPADGGPHAADGAGVALGGEPAAGGRATQRAGCEDASGRELAARIEDAVTGAVVLTTRSAAGIAMVLAHAASHGTETRGVRFWPVSAVADEASIVRVALDALAAGAAVP